MEIYNIALLGNPNSGKTSLFNQLTGLNQKVGNFSGVTVEKSVGLCGDIKEKHVQIIDLPGTYSLYPKSEDERVVLKTLLDDNKYQPHAVIIIVDVINLQRNLLLLTQVADLGLPCLVALNMNEQALQVGINVDTKKFEEHFGLPAIKINARNGAGLEELKKAVLILPRVSSFCKDGYRQHLVNNRVLWDGSKSLTVDEIEYQKNETLQRYQFISSNIEHVMQKEGNGKKWNFERITEKADAFLVHPFWGYLTFLFFMFILFQAVFTLAEYPMDWIDTGMSALATAISEWLPESKWSDLLTEGVIPGIGGIVIFIPQITFLLLILSVMEESGYMARVMYMGDSIMRKFGLNGRSIIPLISATACAIPAILGTRSIDNRKERLLTILVTPLISCSARLPVYAIIIALVIPDGTWFGIIGYKGVALFVLYISGFVFALLSAVIFQKIIKTKDKSFFVLEVPSYRFPRMKNVGRVVYNGVTSFVFEAGRIIITVSVVLWLLSTYGPSNSMQLAEDAVRTSSLADNPDLETEVTSARLEASYIGKMGKFMEPVIEPLGYNWKIGVALITSFAAREIFVGSLSVIYSVDEEDTKTLKEKLASEINPKTGEPVFNLASGCSLLVFYLFALQCMSTLAIVKRETHSWKWPAIQFIYMGALAYFGSLLTYQLLH